MSTCNISVSFSGTPAEVFERARAAVHEQGGRIQGNDQLGEFELTVLGSTVCGSYQITGQALHVTIESKPSMIPCSTIQSYLAKHLETVGAKV